MPGVADKTITGIKLPLDHDDRAVRAAAAQAIGCAADDLGPVRVVRRSLDARGRRPPHFVATIAVAPRGTPTAPAWSPPRYGAPRRLDPRERPLIVGAGPAGLFCALRLLEHGIAARIVERGQPVEVRGRQVAAFRRHGVLDPESNLCFGEGGAGTFSDGKLYTRKHHPLVRTVLEWFVAFGAPEVETLVDARPHVGTNRLIPICRAIRAALLDHDVSVDFGARVDRLALRSGDQVAGVELADGTTIDASRVVLATGHSARDLYATLQRQGAAMEAKPFAVGFRVEHPQALVDRAQLGRWAGHAQLGAAAYRLTCRVGDRGAYSFCMCPGGFVVPSPSAPDRLNVNGMSNSNRGGPFANSAVVVTVDGRDFGLHGDGPEALAGVRFQERLEAACFQAGGGGYVAPAQRVPDFLAGRGGDLPTQSSYRPGVTPGELGELLPRALVDPLRDALRHFGRKLRGFDSAEGLCIGLETTTSAPLRVLRDDASRASSSLPGLYPCGEGAGYAGGIVSSAIDGMLTADAIAAAMR